MRPSTHSSKLGIARVWRFLIAVAVVASAVAAAAAAARDPLTGVWVAHDVAGDQSTDRYIFSGPNAEGVRTYKLVDSYGTFCETDGPGTGSVMTASGTARLEGVTVSLVFESYVCANGSRDVFDPPLSWQATVSDGSLDFGYYVATRVGQ